MQYTASEFVKVVQSVRPKDHTASVNGVSFDKTGFHEAIVVLSIGAVSGTTPTLDVKIQDSADDSSFADVTGAVFTQKTDAAGDVDEDHNGRLKLDGLRQYVRAVFTIAGTSPNFGADCSFVLLNANKIPVSQQNTPEFNV